MIKRKSVKLLYTLIILAILMGCRPQAANFPNYETAPRINPPAVIPEALAEFPNITARHADVPEDYEAVAENGVLRLYVRKASSAVIIEDLRSGHLWRSSPPDIADNKGTTTAWRRQIEVPVQVSYVDPERAQPKNAKVDRGVDYAFQAMNGGLQVRYDIKNLKISFDVVYTLQDDCINAIIPETSMKEDGDNGFVSIDLLAFLGATHDGDDGYIIYPDGSGGLMRFDTPHPDEVQKITSTIYGTDASGGLIGTQTTNYREQVSMPVFGLVSGPAGSAEEDRAGFVGMVTQGDFDASLGVARSGKGINYNHVWTSFIFRRQGRFSLTGGQPTWLFEPDRIKGDRAVRYCFMNGKDASYINMGTRYRDFLMNERGAKRIAGATGAGEATGTTPRIPRMDLAFFMGIERRTWFLSDMISMTSFAQVKNILSDLEKAGVVDVDVTLYQWNRGGTANKYPERLPADPRLGGDAGLKDLASSIHQRGQRLFLLDNYIGVPPGARGFTPYLDAARGVDGLPVGGSDVGYLVNPQIALRNFGFRDLTKMQAYGADGMTFVEFAFLTIPDKNQRYPLSRENFAATYMQFGRLSRELFGAVAMEGANIYTVPYTDKLNFVTIDSTQYDLFEETVPLYQIAIHGLVAYSANDYNLMSDGQRMFLRQVEYGAIPAFLLTENNSAQLMRTEANFVYSSQYAYWRDEIIRQYKVVEKLQPLAGQFITGHEKLAEKVYQTEYEDSTRVIVNYSAQPYQAGSATVPANDFIVIRGD